MATCKDCIHEKVCNALCPNGLLPYQSNDYPAELFCLEFKNKADVQEVKHGYWKQNQYHKNIYYCSECGRHIEDGSDNPLEHFPYCHCGAKMNLEVTK